MKLTIAMLAMLFSFTYTYSQTSLNFCASVDPNGYCFFNNNKFFFPTDSNNINVYVQVKDEKTFGTTTKITYKFYTVDKSGAEKYESMFEQNVQGAWMFAWLPHTFNKAGKYNIKVFGDANQLLCSKNLELFDGK